MITLTIAKQAHGYQGFAIVPCEQAPNAISRGDYVTLEAPGEKPFWGKMVQIDTIHDTYIIQFMGIDQVPFHCEPD